jgi:lipopolysaccharide/colanic/teichoic acid biosynthesis glycosyltransferase/carbonic anhydrase/acetyltransferase-like protein (isoleucine patch superfamily)
VRLYPVVLDSRPGYLRGSLGPLSLLLMPLGTDTLLGHLRERFHALNRNEPTVLPTFPPDAGYEAAVRTSCPSVEGIIPSGEFGNRVGTLEPSDWLLFVDPRWFPAGGYELGRLVEDLGDGPQWARHELALERTTAGTEEYVQLDWDGAVRRIQRYYASVTWPFTSGVSCSLVPVAAILMAKGLSFSSLADLRRGLTAKGVPSRDLPLAGGTFDLSCERGLLALSERFTLDALAAGPGRVARAGARGQWGAGCRVHPTARLLGPVILHDGVVIEEGATLAGPTVVGAGSRVGAGAVVAQCLLGPGSVLPRGTTVRQRVVWDGSGSDVLDVPAGSGTYRPFQGIGSGSGAPPVELREPGQPAAVYPRAKRAAEALAALAALLVLSPLLGLVAALVKLTSKGPILFGDEREGLNGRPFCCWKFRTMVDGAHSQQRHLYAQNQVDGPQFKLDHDPRVTWIGRLLRPSSLDELPQLLNVLLGQMSLVGPRPSPFRENQMCIPWRKARLSVRPGITGLWQICRHDRDKGDFHQWIYYDLLYARHMSLWLDIKILAATVATLGGRGHVPLSWMISPHKYYERRRSRREPRFSLAQLLSGA